MIFLGIQSTWEISSEMLQVRFFPAVFAVPLQVAAGTLDASAKIYAVRVDSVHADTFKVLSHLGKESAPAKDLDSSQEGGNSLFSSPKSQEIPSFPTQQWEEPQCSFGVGSFK